MSQFFSMSCTCHYIQAAFSSTCTVFYLVQHFDCYNLISMLDWTRHWRMDMTGGISLMFLSNQTSLYSSDLCTLVEYVDDFARYPVLSSSTLWLTIANLHIGLHTYWTTWIRHVKKFIQKTIILCQTRHHSAVVTSWIYHTAHVDEFAHSSCRWQVAPVRSYMHVGHHP